MELLPDPVRKVLEQEGLMESVGQVNIYGSNSIERVQSMPACFRKLNINSDYKNDAPYTLHAINAKVSTVITVVTEVTVYTRVSTATTRFQSEETFYSMLELNLEHLSLKTR